MIIPQDLLNIYKKKRNFSQTPEPENNEKFSSGYRFVIQKHWASKLHYDFRLELGGTLKSWAVPKGPSFDPTIKRLAVQVEDHPISYAAFEGTIPPKQYGAGKVIVWDEGTWQPLGDAQTDYTKGNLKFVLLGQKLQGKWALIKIKGKTRKQQPWLLIKEKDSFARSYKEFSVVDALPDSVKSFPILPSKSNITAVKDADSTETILLKSGAVKAELPVKLSPQLATLTEDKIDDSANWIFEIKYDGYRLLTRIANKEVKVFTRNGNDWTEKLTFLVSEIKQLYLPDGWYDGEIVVLNDLSIPDFGLLQQSIDEKNTKNIVLYLFDLPYYSGFDLTLVPLALRKLMLNHLFTNLHSDSVKLSQTFDQTPKEIYDSACRLGLEGIIAKHKESHYLPRRTYSWLKLKCGHRQEFIVAGYTEPSGSRDAFGSLILAIYDENGQLTYVGNVGSGFNKENLDSLKKKMHAIGKTTNLFKSKINVKTKPHWINPTLVVEVAFAGWTRDEKLRHPVYKGIRMDKNAVEIRKEVSQPSSLLPFKRTNKKPKDKMQITHPERVIDEMGTTKLDVFRYYDLVKEFMMPHLNERPVSLLRAPSGINGQIFFQKHAEVERLKGISQIETDNTEEKFLQIVSSQGILSAAQWNVFEFHTSNNFSKKPKHPNRIVFDLDPGEGVSWRNVQEGALIIKSFLDALSLSSFIKTSGGNGLHVVVPISPKYQWEEVKDLSASIVKHIAQTLPKKFVAKSGPKNRVGKIFIDYLRNGSSATTVSAWSARARQGLGISIPIGWEELSKVTGGDHWTIKTIHTRLDVGNEPWQQYPSSKSDLREAFKQFTKD